MFACLFACLLACLFGCCVLLASCQFRHLLRRFMLNSFVRLISISSNRIGRFKNKRSPRARPSCPSSASASVAPTPRRGCCCRCGCDSSRSTESGFPSPGVPTVSGFCWWCGLLACFFLILSFVCSLARYLLIDWLVGCLSSGHERTNERTVAQ